MNMLREMSTLVVRCVVSTEFPSLCLNTDEHQSLRRIRRVSISSSESDSPSTLVDGTTVSSRRHRHRSSSPRAHKRKSTASAPSAKRKKSSTEPSSAAKDAARKFCLGKLEQLFVPIFTRYPYLPVDGGDEPTPREVDSLTDEDKQTVEQNGKTYAHDVEAAMFDFYAEPDKSGKPTVAGRYKYLFLTSPLLTNSADILLQRAFPHVDI